jgi:hypothetical protein
MRPSERSSRTGFLIFSLCPSWSDMRRIVIWRCRLCANDTLILVRRWRRRRETLRGWMIAAALWIDRRHRLPSPHQPRRRRDCFGELVQIDGSEHAWFEDREEKCTLLAFVDDATSRLMHLRFVASESTFDYFRATRTYLETHGRPVAFYSDKHGIFSGECQGGRGRRWRDTVRPRPDRTEHRHPSMGHAGHIRARVGPAKGP